MRKIKNIFLTVCLLALSTIISSCSGCDNENPRAKVTNLGTDRVSVQIKTTGGNTENINNIEPNSSSSYVSYSPGEVTFTIVLDDQSEVEEIVMLNYCTDYEITVEANNEITTTAVDRD